MIRRLTLVTSLPEVGQRDLILPGGRDLEPFAAGATGWSSDDISGIQTCWSGDDHAARATAVALGLTAEPQTLLSARDLGSWQGRSLVELADQDRASVERFQSDLGFAPPGGESLLDVVGRVAEWVDGAADGLPGRTLVVVDPDIVRAAVAVTLDAPTAMLRVDAVGLSHSVLTHSGSGWRVRTVSTSESRRS